MVDTLEPYTQLNQIETISLGLKFTLSQAPLELQELAIMDLISSDGLLMLKVTL